MRYVWLTHECTRNDDHVRWTEEYDGRPKTQWGREWILPAVMVAWWQHRHIPYRERRCSGLSVFTRGAMHRMPCMYEPIHMEANPLFIMQQRRAL